MGSEKKFCESCDCKVIPEYRMHETQFPICGRMETIAFQAAYCPVCGAVICEKGFDVLFLEKVQQRIDELKRDEKPE